ncbi:hypothetical protein AB1L05_11815 [Cytobacillus horneckiae]
MRKYIKRKLVGFENWPFIHIAFSLGILLAIVAGVIEIFLQED